MLGNSQTAFHSLAAYPPWLVFACAAIAAVFLLWLAGRLLKWSLEVLPLVVLFFGGALVVWWLLR